MIFQYVKENKKYYFGKTINPDFRLKQYFNFLNLNRHYSNDCYASKHINGKYLN